jgi:hypothetical protein
MNVQEEEGSRGMRQPIIDNSPTFSETQKRNINRLEGPTKRKLLKPVDRTDLLPGVSGAITRTMTMDDE